MRFTVRWLLQCFEIGLSLETKFQLLMHYYNDALRIILMYDKKSSLRSTTDMK